MVCLIAQASPLEEVVQHAYWRTTVELAGRKIAVTVLSNHIVMQMLAAALLLGVLIPALRVAGVGRESKTDWLVPRGLRNFFEAICEFFRQHLARPQLGEHTDRLMPFIWTVFFYILTCNLLGLLPLEAITKPILGKYAFGGTPTGNIWTNGTLALMALAAILFNGFRVQGIAYLKHFCPGPVWMAPLLVVVEVIGLLAKIFALAVRLFANMLAGHILLAVLISFVGMAYAGLGTLGGIFIAIPVVLGSVAINLLEVFVAFIQAFIFTFLTVVFIGQAISHEGEHAEAERHRGRSAEPAVSA